jgi:hypothetical protein
MKTTTQRKDEAVQFALQTMRERGELHSMFVAFRGDEVHLFAVPFADEQQKQIVLALLNVVFVTGHFDQYIHMSEAWMSRTLGKRPAEADDRIEVVVVASVTPSDRDMTVYEIKRENDKIADLVEHSPGGEKMQAGGRIVSLFEPLEGTPPQILAMAQEMFSKFAKPITFH